MFLRSTAVLICLSFALAGCEEKPAAPASPASGAASAPATTPAAASSGQFDSAEAAVKSMIDAAGKKDKDLLSKCFAPSSEKEFKAFVDKSAKDKDYSEFAEFVKDAQVGETKLDGTDNAAVKVKFTKREETIRVVKKDGRWWVQGF